MFQLHRFQGEQQVAGGDPLADLRRAPGSPRRAAARAATRPPAPRWAAGDAAARSGSPTRPGRPRRPPTPTRCTRYARRTPSTSSTTRSGVGLDQRHGGCRRPLGGSLGGRRARPVGEAAGPVQPVADLDLVAVRSGEPADLRDAGTLRQPEGSPASTGAVARRCGGAGQRGGQARRAGPGRPGSSGAKTSGCRSRKPVSISPAANSGLRSTRTSRSRLVATPCSSARASAPASSPGRLGAGRRPGDQLGQHRVVVHADHRAVHARRSPAAGPAAVSGRTRRPPPATSNRCRVPVDGQPARAPGPRRRAVPRSRGRRVGGGRGERQRLALGDQQLQPDQVQPGDALGDRVLDLQPGVHLQEEELAVRGEQELHRAGADVADRPAGGHRRLVQRRRAAPASTAGDGASSTIFWCRRWIEHSRSPSATHGAVGVAEDLHLDVPAALDVPLAEDRAVAERGGRLAARGGDRLGQLGRRSRTIRMPRPPPPADALTSTGKSVTSSVSVQVGSIGTPASASSAFAASLSPIAAIALAGGPTQVSPASVTAARELGVLGEEAVAGVDGVRAGCGGPRPGSGRPAGTSRPACCPAGGPPGRPRRTCGASASASE